MTARMPRLRHRTDWFRILVDLQTKGYNGHQVGRIIDVPYSTIRYWKQGGEPSHAAGHSLLELWSEATGNTHASRPMIFG